MEAIIRKSESLTLEVTMTRKELETLVEGIGETSALGLIEAGMTEAQADVLYDLWRALMDK